MEKYIEALKRVPLFEGMEEDSIFAMVDCLQARVTQYHKNQIIFSQGEKASLVGIVLKGEIEVVNEDYYGNSTILTRISPPQLFGEVFTCANVESLPVSLVAKKDSTIMLVDCKKILTTCGNSCEFHNRLIHNLLKIVASKNLILNEKIQITSKRTTKEKIMAFLLSQAKEKKSNSFEIAFDRQALADYLCVERSAMSAEIGKLRDEGIIAVDKKHFSLLKNIYEENK